MAGMKKKLRSKPEVNSPFLSPPPSSIVILLQSWARAPEGPAGEHGSAQLTTSQVGPSGKFPDGYLQIALSLCKKHLPEGGCLNEIPYVILNVLR